MLLGFKGTRAVLLGVVPITDEYHRHDPERTAHRFHRRRLRRLSHRHALQQLVEVAPVAARGAGHAAIRFRKSGHALAHRFRKIAMDQSYRHGDRFSLVDL